MGTSFRRSFSRAGGKMAEAVVGAGMKELLTQMLETPEVKENRQLELLLKSAQIKAAEADIPTEAERSAKLEYQQAQTKSAKELAGYRRRSPGMGHGTPGQPTFGNTALIYSQVANEIRGRADVMVGLMNGTYTEDDIDVMINQAADTRTDAILQKSKEMLSGQKTPKPEKPPMQTKYNSTDDIMKDTSLTPEEKYRIAKKRFPDKVE